jgi:hypothetical protein
VDEITLPEGFYNLGESFWLRASMFGGGGPCPFLNYTLALQLRKSMENLSHPTERAETDQLYSDQATGWLHPR